MPEWKFDLSQYDSVWKLVVNVGLLLIALLLGNALRRSVPYMRKAFIPSALIGGLMLFIINVLCTQFAGVRIVDKRIMQIITYHALGIGFIGMTLKTVEKARQKQGLKVVQNGLLTGGTYMLQAVVGLIITLIFYWAGSGLFYDSGVILPLGYGQGPGNALTWDLNFTALTHEADYAGASVFEGEGSFGLTIASVGFIVASIVGVIYINVFKSKGQINPRVAILERKVTDFEENNEIEDSESVDKTTIQMALVSLAYAMSFGIMFLFSKLTDWTSVKLFNDVAWGFNFIWGVISATLIKAILKFFEKRNIVRTRYINNYQMDRISGFAFDMMIIAGVTAIDINVIKKYALVIIILCLVGAVVTFFYVYFMCKKCFGPYAHEAFLLNFGTLTGTASNGMILLREIDPNFETPIGNIYILSQFPAMVAVAPLLLLLNMGAKSVAGCLITLGIFAALFASYTLVMVITANRTAAGTSEK